MNASDTLVFKHEVEGVVAAHLDLLCGVDDAEILNLETLPSHRRQGLAAGLLAEALAWARQNQRQAVWLEVRVNNDVAIALYRKAGFTPINTRKNYYSGGEDAIVMKYDL